MNRNIITSILTISFILFVSSGFVFAAEDTGARKVGDAVEYRMTADPDSWADLGTEWVWTHRISSDDATFIKIHFVDFNLPEGAVVELYDADMNLVNSYTGNGPRDLVNFWATGVQGNEVMVEARTPVHPKSVQFSIDMMIPGYAPIFPESICGSDDLENINCKSRSSQIMTNEKAVGHIVFVKNGSSYVCTGSLVSANSHFLTNEHCIPSQTICNTMDVYFEYETSSSASCTSNSASKGTAFSCDTFLTVNANYDFGLMTLANSPAASRGYCTPNGKNLSNGESLYIIQHPNGYPKKIAFGTVYDNVTNGNVSGSDCEYQIDTMGGSSGSPVFDGNGDIVALHHWGGCGSSSGNQGVLMSKIYPYISSYLGGGSTGGDVLKVTVDITHTYIGDLSVVLTTPSSQTVTLHNREGGSADDINTTYTVSGWDGDWTGTFQLYVADHVGQDVGTLNSWSVEATPDGGSTHNGSSYDTPTAIPDANPDGGIYSYIYM